MKNLKQRVVTTALAGAMALSMAVPAFAAGTTTKVTASYKEITIDVVVPGTLAATINPMGMPVKLPAGEGSTAKEVSNKIVSNPAAVINRSSMDLVVGATLTGEVKGNLKLAPTAWDDTDATKIPTTNSAFIILEMKKAGAAVLNDEGTNTDADKIAAEWEKWTSQDFATDFATADAVADKAKGTDDADDAVLVLGTKAVSTGAEGLVKLKAADIAADSTVTVDDDGVGFFRLDGQVVESPKTAWAKADGFSATIAFTFKAEKPAATQN